MRYFQRFLISLCFLASSCCLSAQTISSLSPTSAEPLTAVTISGSGFGTSWGTVTLNGQSQGLNSWADGSVSFNVASGASSGNVVVTTHSGVQSNGVAFTVLQPTITSLSPSSGAPGTLITIAGNNFGSNSGSVTFNGQTATPIYSWADATVKTYVPSGGTTGNVVVNTYGSLHSSGVLFTVSPIITSLTPVNAEPGKSVTIAGKNFTSTAGTVTLAGQSVSVSNWTNTSITMTIPNGAASGNVVVTAGTLSSAGAWFGVLRPAIASLSPTSGLASTSVVIAGNHFGSSAGSVSFNGQSASVSNWSDTSITAVVPSSATTGNVSVTTTGAFQSNGVNFVIGPTITGLSPGSGSSGTAVTITGVNFGSAAGSVSFNGVLATSISSWTNNSITASVPNGAHSGPVAIILPGGGATITGPVFVVPTINNLWDEADIGTVGAAGSTSVNSGAYTVTAYSGNLGGTTDSLHYLYQPVSGDFDLILRANVQTWSDYYHMQYGITVRDSFAPGGVSYSCLGQLGGYTATASRTSVNGTGTDQAYYSGLQNPGWLRVKRYGNTFVCFVSNNGTTWSKWSQASVPVSPNALVGASVMSSNQSMSKVVFDNVSLSTASGSLPSPWLIQDMGTNSGSGDAIYSGGVFTVASNSDVMLNSGKDNATFVYQAVSGDVDIRAHVTWNSLISTSGAATGIMIRQSLAPDDVQFSCLVTQNSNGASSDARSIAGASNAATGITNSATSWLRLVKRGALFDCYISSDGTNWTLGSSTATELNMPTTVEAGLFLSSGSGQPISVASFDTVTVNGIAPVGSPWQQQDIGSVNAAGDATLSSGAFTIESNSYDIGGSSDNLHYVYQQSGGDLSIIARVSWQQWGNVSGYAKSGVMVRQSLGATDLQFSCLLSAQYYVYSEWRTSSGATDQSTTLYSGSTTYWVKIARQGNNFTCSASSNGTSWTTVQTATVAMSSDVYVGFAQSSYDGSYSLATVDNLNLQGNLPTVAMTYPVAGSTVYMSQPVVLTATANPSPGATVTQVQFFDGQTLLGSAVSAPYSLNIGVLPEGSHTFTAQVTDSAGLQALSVTDTATLSNPQITSVTPDHGQPGTKVRILGRGFGASAAGVVVSFNGVPAFMTGFSDGEMDVIVPSGAGNGMMGVSWPDGAGADGAPPFGPCSYYCVTSFTLSPTVIPGDGSTGVTGSVVITGPANANVTGWDATINAAVWGESFTCVSPDFYWNEILWGAGCGGPSASFNFLLGPPTVGTTQTDTLLAYTTMSMTDPGLTAQVTIVAPGQANGSPENGPCTTCPQPVAGQPINLMTGNTYIQTTDYSLPGLGGGIAITRTWNSRWASTFPLASAGMFGDSWRSTYEDRIQTTNTGVNYWLGDGKVWRFSINNGIYTLTSPVDAHGNLAYDSVAQQYTLTFVNGAKEIFSSTGYLVQVVDRNGNAATLTYDGSNHLTQVLDAGGRTLTFAYGDSSNPNQVTSMTDAVGTIATYTYGASSRLTNVTYADGSQLNYTYDANGLITSVTDALGKVLEAHTYDSQRRGLTSQLANGVEAVSVSYPQPHAVVTFDSAGNSSTYASSPIGEKSFIGSVSGPGCASCGIRGFNQYTYDSNGNVIASFDSNGVPTLYTYDANGNMTSSSTPLNNRLITSQYTYNSFGELLTSTDPLGNTTSNTYDANGNLLTVTTPAPDGQTAASVTTFAYDSKGQLTSVTDPLNHSTTLAYYPTGLLHSVTDAQNNVTTFNYDQRGNRTDVYDALNNHTAFAYDGRNRLTTITNSDTSTIGFAYDTRGRKTSVTDGNGKVTQYAYDDADRLTSVTDANNNATQYAYDLENNLTSITDANNHTTSFAYDKQGHLTKTTFPSTKVETYTYDNVGNLMTKIDRKNQVISYAYDTLNRMVSKMYPDSTNVTYTYDDASRLTQVQDATGTYSFLFDNMGRLKQTTTAYSFLSGNPFTVVYGYDAASNRTGMTDPNNGQTTYTYDTLNRLTNILDFNNNNFGLGYDVLGRRTQLTRPNGIATNYSYDSVSNLLSVLHQQGVNTLDGATYTYDSAGNRKRKTNLLNSATGNFSYDNIYQLTGVTGTNPESYTYDPVGNRLTSQNIASYTYNSSNELTSTSPASYTYDDNGNMRTKTDSTGTATYNWDFENRLVSVQLPNSTTVNFKYDPFGRRIQKSGASTTNYVYDGANVIEEVDQSGNILARYTQGSGIDEPLSELRSGAISYYEQDGLGSVTSLSGVGGMLANTYVYDSFGNTTTSTGTLANPYQYTGRDYDSETGLRYYRARYYDSSTGRFLSEDPLGFGGVTSAYSYAGNQALDFVDPLGLAPVHRNKSCKEVAQLAGVGTDAGLLARLIYIEATGYDSFPRNDQLERPEDPMGGPYYWERMGIAEVVYNRLNYVAANPNHTQGYSQQGATIAGVIGARNQFAGFYDSDGNVSISKGNRNRINNVLNSDCGSDDCTDLIVAIYVANAFTSGHGHMLFGGSAIGFRTTGHGSPGDNYLSLGTFPGSGITFYGLTGP